MFGVFYLLLQHLVSFLQNFADTSTPKYQWFLAVLTIKLKSKCSSEHKTLSLNILHVDLDWACMIRKLNHTLDNHGSTVFSIFITCTTIVTWRPQEMLIWSYMYLLLPCTTGITTQREFYILKLVTTLPSVTQMKVFYESYKDKHSNKHALQFIIINIYCQ